MADTRHNILEWLGRQEEFRPAVEFTAAQTGFIPALIEKDYWCSVVLWGLFADNDCPLVFKGGTLLSKAYVTFNRLSEDLDFTLPNDETIPRSQRSRRAREIATRVRNVAGEFQLEIGEWQSFNNSTQHQVTLKYDSVFGGQGTIKLEVGQREKLILPKQRVGLSTLLLNPLFNETAVAPVMVTALTAMEAYAEKVRATLTRREPAPRDLYDLHHAVTSGVLNWQDGAFLNLAALKLANEPDTDWLADARIQAFRRSTETELRPVLRVAAFDAFDLDAALASMVAVANALKVRSHRN